MSNSTLLGDYLQQGSGAPSGAPPVASGVTAFYWDDSGHALYAYDWVAAAWKAAGDGGSGFNPYFPSSVSLTVPTASAFTKFQAGTTSTMTDLASGRGVSLRSTLDTANDNFVTAEQSVLSTSAFTITALLHSSGTIGRMYSGFGVGVKDTTGNYEFWLGPNANNTAGEFSRDYWESLTSFSAHNQIMSMFTPIPNPMWWKLELSGGNFIFYLSHDGETWVEVDSSSATAWLETPSTVFFFADMNNGATGHTFSQVVNCYSWTNTTP